MAVMAVMAVRLVDSAKEEDNQLSTLVNVVREECSQRTIVALDSSLRH